MGTGNLFTTTTNPTILHRSRVLFHNLASYFVVGFLFILLAGHENTNPRLGESHIDFYQSECQHLLEIHAKASQFNPQAVSGSMDFFIEALTSEFYAQRHFSPAWTINYTGTGHLDTLIQLLDSAVYFGLPEPIINAASLNNTLFEMEKDAFDDNKLRQRVQLELAATRSAIKYMLLLSKGIRQNDTTQQFLDYAFRMPHILNTSIETNNLSETILAQQPNIPMYNSIIAQLPVYIETLKNISKSTDGLAKSILASVLFYEGILEQPAFDSLHSVEQSIKIYQAKNHLSSTGKLCRQTVNSMAERLEKNYMRIALNLDRLRKVEITSGNFIFVNIPSYSLHAFHNNKEEKTFNVVVGKEKTPTPVLSSRLEKIITNPYWTVPKSIAYNEMLSRIRKDSSYLKRNRYFIINWKEETVHDTLVNWYHEDPLGKRYWIRQENGWGNALGKVKFIFPNNYRVYLHDTPSKRLFKREHRAFSHGCIRVQHPDKLAQYLSDKYYAPYNDSISISESIAGREREVFDIAANVEVHIQYITCSADTENGLKFHKDLYKQDKTELEAIFEWQKAI